MISKYNTINKHIYEIDLFRVIGAAGIVMYHYTARSIIVDGDRVSAFPIVGAITRYGFLGVNIFFLISGFVILFSAMNK